MSAFYTVSQREAAREELIGAYIGVSPRHSMTLDAIDTTKTVQLKKPSQESHLTSGKEKRRGRSIPLISDRHYEQSKLLKQVRGLSPLTAAWVDAAYHTKQKDQLVKLLTAVYFEKYRIRKGTESMIEKIIDVTVSKSLVTVQGVHEITDSQIAVHLERSRRAYRDNWKIKVDELHQFMMDIDEAVIDHVCAVLCYREYKPSIKPSILRRKHLMYTTKN